MSKKIHFLTSLLALSLSVPAMTLAQSGSSPAPAKKPAPAAPVVAQAAAAAPAAPAQAAPPSIAEGTVFSLEQFGPIATVEQAQAAYEAASAAMIPSGGGTLLIPKAAPANWRIVNNTQLIFRQPAAPAQSKRWGVGVGITVVDLRAGTLNILPPQQTGINISRILDLPVGETLPHWNYSPMVNLTNVILRGSTSYHDWIQEDVAAGTDQKFYVATIRGLFPGMFLTVQDYSTTPRLCVRTLGYDADKKLWFFTADTDVAVKKGMIVSNKSQTPILKLDTYSHDENQTFDIVAWRHNYSQGDNYIMDARFFYQGDNHSTAGDENYVNYAAFENSDTYIFRAKVASFKPDTGELKFTGGTSADHLGSGRPIINLNTKKWITAGKVVIVRPANWTFDKEHGGDTSSLEPDPVYKGKSYPTTIAPDRIGSKVLHMGGLIQLSADAPVGDEVVGRYFAVTEPDELVPARIPNVRRWYLINSITKNPDGTKTISIIRHWWGAKDAASPTLYNFDNYSCDGHEKPLSYVIAPGANASDVSEGVESPNNNQQLPPSKHTLTLSPYPDGGKPFDFAPGDPIEQAIGPDPFRPVAFRSWCFEDIPGVFPAPFFDISNQASPQRYSVMTVHGGDSNIDKCINGTPEVPATADKPKVPARPGRYDHKASFNMIFRVESTANTGIDFAADVANAAILFEQPNEHAQPIKWRYLKNTRETSLTVSPTDGSLRIDAPSVSLPGVTDVAGISGSATKAANLRGIKFPVKAGATTVTIKFPKPEADAEYAVFLELSWLSNHAVTAQTADGITVQFDKAPAADATLHWLIVR